jgi:Ca2+-binding RTX toxin-like protein
MSTNSTAKQIYFIDFAVPDSKTILDGLPIGSIVYQLNPTQDGLQQIADILTNYSNIDTIHIISHGASGSLQLGNSLITQADLTHYSQTLTTIGNALTSTGDILLYGCDVAQGDVGQAFIEQFAVLIGVDIAASNDLTGAANKGGDWVLESNVGQIETNSLSLDYSGTLSNIGTNPLFDYIDALTAAEFSKWAYSHHNGGEVKATSDWLKTCNYQAVICQPATGGTVYDTIGGYEVGNNYAFAARQTTSNGTVKFIISFEGSNSDQLGDWTSTNLSEYGWSNYYVSLMPLMTQVIKEAMTEKDAQHNVDILITGHSLGGAVASVAFADLFLNPNQNFWAENNAPLQNGSRIYDQVLLNTWSDAQIHSLIENTSVYTFGAPSFLIDPVKPNSSEWIGLASDIVDCIFNTLDGNYWGALSSASKVGSTVANGFIVDNALTPNLSGIDNHLFQFEHEDSSITRLPDPVSSIGTQDAGTVLDIDLTPTIHDYYDARLGMLSMHSMDGYLDSIARLLTGNDIIKTNSPASINSPLPNINTDTSGNNFFLGDSSAGNGNDVLIADAITTSTFLDGGAGKDAYIIRDYGVNVALSGVVSEKQDVLYFNLAGNISTSVSGEDLVITISTSSLQSTATVKGWYSSIGNYQLADIAIIIPRFTTGISTSPWDVTHYTFDSLNIPLFNNGTSNNDNIVGSLSGDTMNGGDGNDIMNGQDGNDTIYGDPLHSLLSGNDTIYGGSGNDTIEGGWGVNYLYGDLNNDTLISTSLEGDFLFGGFGDDTYIVDVSSNVSNAGFIVKTVIDEHYADGNDQIVFIGNNIDSSKTRFYTQPDNSLLVKVFNGNNVELGEIQITDMQTVNNQVESLTLQQGSVVLAQYNLQTVWTAALAGDNTGNGAGTTFTPNPANHAPTDLAINNKTSDNTKSYPSHTLGEYRNYGAFAAIKDDGSVVTWGYASYGGDSTAVATALNGSNNVQDVKQIYSSNYAFAALRADGSVVTLAMVATVRQSQ